MSKRTIALANKAQKQTAALNTTLEALQAAQEAEASGAPAKKAPAKKAAKVVKTAPAKKAAKGAPAKKAPAKKAAKVVKGGKPVKKSIKVKDDDFGDI